MLGDFKILFSSFDGEMKTVFFFTCLSDGYFSDFCY